MAREDTRWFAVAVVILSFVMFMALPLSMLILVDHLKLKAQVKAEAKAEIAKVRELRKQLEEELKKLKE